MELAGVLLDQQATAGGGWARVLLPFALSLRRATRTPSPLFAPPSSLPHRTPHHYQLRPSVTSTLLVSPSLPPASFKHRRARPSNRPHHSIRSLDLSAFVPTTLVVGLLLSLLHLVTPPSSRSLHTTSSRPPSRSARRRFHPTTAAARRSSTTHVAHLHCSRLSSYFRSSPSRRSAPNLGSSSSASNGRAEPGPFRKATCSPTMRRV